MSDIAARAGVSQTTVSFVLNGRSSQVKIAEETRQRVLDAAREMGYRRNELARAMVTGRTRVIGFLTYDAGSEHIWAMISGALDEAANQGYSVKVQRLPFYGNEEEIRQVIHNCSTWRMDGIIALSLKKDALALLSTEMKSTGWRIVYIENAPENSSAVQVGSDAYEGIESAVKHLAELGHHRIAFMTGPMESVITMQRNQFFLDVTQKLFGSNNQCRLKASHWSNSEMMERSVQEILEEPLRPTALMCAGDGAAMIAARVARDKGMRIPHDLSLIGFGNFSYATYGDPPLTSISQPFLDIGRVAMDHLIKAIGAEETEVVPVVDGKNSEVVLPTALVVRQSTGPVPTSL